MPIGRTLLHSLLPSFVTATGGETSDDGALAQSRFGALFTVTVPNESRQSGRTVLGAASSHLLPAAHACRARAPPTDFVHDMSQIDDYEKGRVKRRLTVPGRGRTGQTGGRACVQEHPFHFTAVSACNGEIALESVSLTPSIPPSLPVAPPERNNRTFATPPYLISIYPHTILSTMQLLLA